MWFVKSRLLKFIVGPSPGLGWKHVWTTGVGTNATIYHPYDMVQARRATHDLVRKKLVRHSGRCLKRRQRPQPSEISANLGSINLNERGFFPCRTVTRRARFFICVESPASAAFATTNKWSVHVDLARTSSSRHKFLSLVVATTDCTCSWFRRLECVVRSPKKTTHPVGWLALQQSKLSTAFTSTITCVAQFVVSRNGRVVWFAEKFNTSRAWFSLSLKFQKKLHRRWETSSYCSVRRLFGFVELALKILSVSVGRLLFVLLLVVN